MNVFSMKAEENPNKFNAEDAVYMNRALQLARAGLGSVSPNPMVGAVIVTPEGRIIGEGYHRRCGEAHAEVNAVKSVAKADEHLLKESSVYVTLEPCSHYGKTPPCADLLVDKRFKRVIVGATDPFEKVSGRGIALLRSAGIEVTTGVLEDRCKSLNARFFTAHTFQRPFITLKWAQSSDGFMDIVRDDDEKAFRFSTPTTNMLVHRLRAHHDAIAVGSGTMLADTPLLNVRQWIGDNPRRIVFDRRGRVGKPTGDIPEVLSQLYKEGITSVFVEGGSTILQSFINEGLWDLARVEVSPEKLASRGVAKSPSIGVQPFRSARVGANAIYYYSNNPLVNYYFIENGL